MNSTNNNSVEIAAKKVFSDLYNLIKEDENKNDDKPFKFDLSIMPADIISCIGNHLEDYSLITERFVIFPLLSQHKNSGPKINSRVLLASFYLPSL
jgi:hypothetical protein